MKLGLYGSNNVESCMELTEATTASKAEDSNPNDAVNCSPTGLTVGDVMSRCVVTVAPHQDIVDAALKMAQHSISCVVVTVRATVVGILTETDFRRMVVAEGDNLYRTQVADVMSEAVATVCPETSVLEASRIMQEKKIRRLPVLDGKVLIGIVTQTDLTRALTSFGHWMDVQEIMTEPVSEIQIGSSVLAAARFMNVGKISSLIVVSANGVEGILSQRDILKKVIAERLDPKDTDVEEIMSSPVISVRPTTSVFGASKTMTDLNIRRLVVMDEKQAYGIITQTDIFSAVEQKLRKEEAEQQRLHQAIRSEARAKTLNMATALLLLGGVLIAGILMAVL